MLKIGYKVVAFVEGELISATWNALRNPVYYILGNKTIPHHNAGPLCVWDSLEHAQKFIERLKKDELFDGKTFHIFKCEYEESQVDHVWESKFPGSVNYGTMMFPKDILGEGVELANWVKLIHEIKIKED